MKVYPIVEGHGEVEAVPVLLRRLLLEARCPHVGVGRPIKLTQAQFRSRDGVQKGIRLALKSPECAAVLVLFDGEDDCPKQLAAQVRAWAQEAAQENPCAVVIAYREYETWFLAALESLRGSYGIAANAEPPINPESKRDAKRALESFMPNDRSYSETRDQPRMTAKFDMATAYRRNRSFRKLVKALGDALTQLQQPLPHWPPEEWKGQN